MIGDYNEEFPTNGKVRIYLSIVKPIADTTIQFKLKFEGEEDGKTVHAWINYAECCEKFTNFGDTTLLSPDETSTVNHTNDAFITVGGYKFIDNYYTLGGDTFPPPPEWMPGEISSYSAIGPTVDGRIKPDIVAPADWIVAAESNAYIDYSNIDVFEHVRIHDEVDNNGEKWYYRYFNGTSAASPVVAGIVALLLEVDPNLDPYELREILQDNAIVDSFTGSVPNNIYGYGKVNAHSSILALLDVVGTNDVNEIGHQLKIYPNPTNQSITIEGLNSGEILRIYSSFGQVVGSLDNATDEKEIFNVSHFPQGIYYIKAFNGNKSITKKFVKTE